MNSWFDSNVANESTEWWLHRQRIFIFVRTGKCWIYEIYSLRDNIFYILSLIFCILLFTDFEILSGNISNFLILLKYVNFTGRQFGKIRSDLSISLLSNKARDFSDSYELLLDIFFRRFRAWNIERVSLGSPLSVRVILP